MKNQELRRNETERAERILLDGELVLDDCPELPDGIVNSFGFTVFGEGGIEDGIQIDVADDGRFSVKGLDMNLVDRTVADRLLNTAIATYERETGYMVTEPAPSKQQGYDV